VSGLDEKHKEVRVIEIEYCLACPYCVMEDWSSDYRCDLSNGEIIGIDVETEIMDGCKLPVLKRMNENGRVYVD